MLLLSHLLLPLLSILHLTTADDPSFSPEDADKYDVGEFGRTPEQKFMTSRVPAYRLLQRQWTEEQCNNEDEYIFIGIRGSRLAHRGPTIFDQQGHQIWNLQGFDKVYNFKPQMYRGKQYLTWWHGQDAMGHGNGLVYMYDQNYQLFKTINAALNYTADLHEFTITPDNTAILTVYDMAPRDLSQWGGTANESFAWDCLFQEIDLESGDLLFQWRASDYFEPDECYNPYRMAGSTGYRAAWDWFHMNSVAKDHKGNYLVSARYSSSLSYIDGRTGAILWKLGGKNNMFSDLSNGRAIDIFGQHSATWQDNDQHILLYDNHGTNWNHTVPSRALKLRVDQEALTVEMIGEAYHPQGYITQSQGSVQQLPNGNIFVGYGFAGAFTEFTPDGSEVVCDWQYAPLRFGPTGAFAPGLIQSYRVYKFPWKGYPLQAPAVAVNDSVFYVSWSGATEQRRWVVEGADDDQEDGDAGDREAGASKFAAKWRSSARKTTQWTAAGETARQGFESAIEMEKEWEMYRLTALDKELQPLGVWTVRKNETIESDEEGTLIVKNQWVITPLIQPSTTSPFTNHPHKTYLLFVVLLLLLFYALSTVLFRVFRLKRSLSFASTFALPTSPRDLKEKLRALQILVLRTGIRVLNGVRSFVSGGARGNTFGRRREMQQKRSMGNGTRRDNVDRVGLLGYEEIKDVDFDREMDMDVDMDEEDQVVGGVVERV